MLNWIVDLIGGAWWTYVVILVASGTDVLFPIIPSETVVLTAGVVAARGELIVYLVAGMAAIGAFAGDNIAYWLGRRFQGTARRFLLRGDKGRRSLEWAERTLQRHGGTFVIVGRYIPGGRTASTVASGVVGLPWRRFAVFDAVGALTWGIYSTMIGYLGGETFRDRTWLALLLAFGISLTVAAAIEGVRWLRGRHGGERGSDDANDRTADRDDDEERSAREERVGAD